MNEPTFSLSPKESALLEKVFSKGDAHGSGGILARRAAVDLMTALLGRSAIPAARLRYFLDPELHIGSSLSRKAVFERNGSRGNTIFEHAHFLPHLRYFIFGTDLPGSVIDEFKATMGNVDYLSGSDLPEIATLVRRLVRQHALDPSDAAEEFFKLAIELGVEPFQARYFRDAAKKVRR